MGRAHLARLRRPRRVARRPAGHRPLVHAPPAGHRGLFPRAPQLPVSRPDEILPHFIRQVMPAVPCGLMLSAIVLASIDSPRSAHCPPRSWADIYRPLLVRGRSERHYLLVSRVAVVVFGVLLGAITHFFAAFDKILWLAFKIAGVTVGSLLGVFRLGSPLAAPRRRRGERGGDGPDGPREPDAARALRDAGVRLCVVLARDPGDGGDDAARARVLRAQ
jgi:hypothetical protein